MHIPKRSLQLPRRTFLRGLGACIAVPFLEAMTPLGRAASLAGPARRMVFIYMPNGMDMESWTPSAGGASYTLPSTLQPLQSLRSHLSVLSGLAHVNARPLGDGPGDHARANACFLTGAHPRKTAGADIKVVTTC